MEIETSNEEIDVARKAVLEFILLNHPVDCPICDQAGECVLQDHYFNYSAQPSRLNHKKVSKDKAKVLGPNVILDAERCIMCTRCIRFCDEIAGESQLTMTFRGEHTEITTFPGAELDNPYATNVVDICPVGALTSREFRFRSRVWFLQSRESVCDQCSRGCKIRVDTYENVPRRYKPLYNPLVNDWWMCDAGRLSYRGTVENRMEGPLAPRDGVRTVVAVTDALEAAADSLRSVEDLGRLAVVVTPSFTNEDALLVARLLAGPLAGSRAYLGGRADGGSDEVLVQADKNPNRRGLDEIFAASGISPQPLASFDGDGLDAALVFGDTHDWPDGGLDALLALGTRIIVGTHMGPLWDAATVFLPGRVHLEKRGTFTNFEGVVQRLEQAIVPAGTCKSEGWYAMALAEQLGDELGFRNPAEVFEAIAETVPAFAGLTQDSLLPHGARLGASAPMAPTTEPTEQVQR
jgi:NADH-quinone oxidoreductase subunit G